MKKFVLLLIVLMAISIGFLSGCIESDEDKAIRIGKAYLKDKYAVLSYDYGEILDERCSDEGDYYKVTLKCKVFSAGYMQTVYYTCKVDKETWEAYGADVD